RSAQPSSKQSNAHVGTAPSAVQAERSSAVQKPMIAATKAKISPGRLLINGEWTDGSKKLDTINPATGEVLTQLVEASADDVNPAVSAARRAFEDRGGPWRKMAASERGRLVWRLADVGQSKTGGRAAL